jgi:serine phosphatase RsbU (regulator of sigma subunit)
VSNSLPYRSIKREEKPDREFEAAYEAERGRWLRRRFMWYLVIGLLMSLVFATFSSNDPEVDSMMRQFMLVTGAIHLLLIIWVWRSRARYATLVTLTIWFFIVGGLAGTVFNYLVFSKQSNKLESEFTRGFEEGFNRVNNATSQPAATTAPTTAPIAATTVPTTAPTTAPNTVVLGGTPMTVRIGGGVVNVNPTQLGQGVAFGVMWGMMIFGLVFSHLVACLLLPWTLRQSIRAALPIILFVFVLVIGDVIMREIHPAWALLPIVALPLGHVPGWFRCWWRYSKFSKAFRLRFESNQYRALRGELDGARQIHEEALPQPIRSGPVRIEYAYEPARAIGGDMLFLHREQPSDPNGAITLVLIDVTGHGIPAALALNRVLGELERRLGENPDATPTEIIIALNRYVHYTMSKNAMFVTALAARVDATGNRIDYVSAGHPPAFMRRADGSVVTFNGNAMLLGCCIDDDFVIDTDRIDFNPGDALLAYTDGANEAADYNGKQLTTAGVRDLFLRISLKTDHREAWPAEMLEGVVHHRGDLPQDDTLFVCVFRPLK